MSTETVVSMTLGDLDERIADARAQGVREAIAHAKDALRASVYGNGVFGTADLDNIELALLPPDPIQGERCRVDNGDDECALPNGHTGGCVGTYTSKPAPPAPEPWVCSNFKDDGEDGSCLYCGVFPNAHRRRP